MKRATIDIGSNSVLLLAGTMENGLLTEVLNESRITSLGKNLDIAKMFNPESMEATFTALKDYKTLLESNGFLVAQTIVTATEALRVAKNAEDFFQKIKNELAKVSYFNAEKIINCDTVVVFNVYNDITLFEEQIKKHLPEGAFNYYLTYIKPLPEAEIKAWMSKQVYLALGVFLIACAQLQIDATPMEGIEIDKYDAILNQQSYTALVAVAIGYRDQEDANQPDRKPKSRLPIDQIIETI